MAVTIELARSYTPGTNYTTFTTAQSMLGTSTATAASQAIQPIWPNALILGSYIRVDFSASVSWATGNTMAPQIKLGSIVVWQGDTLKVTTTGGTLIGVKGHVELQVRSVGTGTLATVAGEGDILGRMIVPPGATPGADYSAGSGSSVLSSTIAAGTGFDSTVQNTLDFFLAMGTSAAANGWRMETYRITLGGVGGP